MHFLALLEWWQVINEVSLTFLAFGYNSSRILSINSEQDFHFHLGKIPHFVRSIHSKMNQLITMKLELQHQKAYYLSITWKGQSMLIRNSIIIWYTIQLCFFFVQETITFRNVMSVLVGREQHGKFQDILNYIILVAKYFFIFNIQESVICCMFYSSLSFPNSKLEILQQIGLKSRTPEAFCGKWKQFIRSICFSFFIEAFVLFFVFVLPFSPLNLWTFPSNLCIFCTHVSSS